MGKPDQQLVNTVGYTAEIVETDAVVMAASDATSNKTDA